MKKAALYIRVSTLEQANEGYSVGEQKERLTAFCKARDWLVTEYYIDPGYSGANLDRPAIQKLIAEAKDVDIVLVYKLDRISRSQRDMLYLIEVSTHALLAERDSKIVAFFASSVNASCANSQKILRSKLFLALQLAYSCSLVSIFWCEPHCIFMFAYASHCPLSKAVD